MRGRAGGEPICGRGHTGDRRSRGEPNPTLTLTLTLLTLTPTPTPTPTLTPTPTPTLTLTLTPTLTLTRWGCSACAGRTWPRARAPRCSRRSACPPSPRTACALTPTRSPPSWREARPHLGPHCCPHRCARVGLGQRGGHVPAASRCRSQWLSFSAWNSARTFSSPKLHCLSVCLPSNGRAHEDVGRAVQTSCLAS